MVLTLTVTAADGCQYGCLHPSEGVVSRSGRLAEGIAGVQLPGQPVRLVAAVRGEEHAGHTGCRALRFVHALQHGFVRE